jgi:hypothetical protein
MALGYLKIETVFEHEKLVLARGNCCELQCRAAEDARWVQSRQPQH